MHSFPETVILIQTQSLYLLKSPVFEFLIYLARQQFKVLLQVEPFPKVLFMASVLFPPFLFHGQENAKFGTLGAIVLLPVINNLREQLSEEAVFDLFLFHCFGVTAWKAELEGIMAFHLIPELL